VGGLHEGRHPRAVLLAAPRAERPRGAIQRPANSVGEGLFPVTIAPAVTFKEDPVIDEMDRVYQATGYGAGADPKSLGYGFFNPKDVVLENGQSLYDAFMQARQTMHPPRPHPQAVPRHLFNSEAYNKAVDADSSSKETSRGDLSRGYMVKQVSTPTTSRSRPSWPRQPDRQQVAHRRSRQAAR
jgi:hypothetical protein